MLVLVADDDRAVRESLERALQLAGYEAMSILVDGRVLSTPGFGR